LRCSFAALYADKGQREPSPHLAAAELPPRIVKLTEDPEDRIGR
jgi:hypothetical protein